MLLARDGKAPKKAQRNPAGGRKPHPNFFLLIGGVIVGVMAVLILVGYVWTPYDTTGMSGADKFLAPCLAHPLGTDNFGRDILSRVMEGAGSTFLIALCVVLIGGIIGTVIGALPDISAGRRTWCSCGCATPSQPFPAFCWRWCSSMCLGWASIRSS